MLSRKEFSRLCPYGYTTSVLSIMPQKEEYEVVLGLSPPSDGQPSLTLDLRLPTPNGPFITIDGVERCVVFQKTTLGVRKRNEITRFYLNRAIEIAMADFIYQEGPPPEGDLVLQVLKSLIVKSDLFIDTSSHELERDGYQQMIRIATPSGNPVDPTWRTFREKDWGQIDPNSTSSGRHINRVFRRGEGEASLSKTLRQNGIALRLLPHRAFLLRTIYERHLPQVMPEAPLVSNPKNQLSGKTLTTALMDLGFTTFEDAIAISQSAATAMTATRRIVHTHIGRKLRMLIKIGDLVDPQEPIAEEIEGESYLHASKIFIPSKLVSVRAQPTVKFQKPCWRYQFVFDGVSSVQTGDKLSTRHGNKGVAWVLDDQDLPIIKRQDGTRHRVDVCISPISVVKRRAMSLYYEMMLGTKALRERTKFEVPAWDVNPDNPFQELVEQGYGDKAQLYLQENKLPEKTFCGPLYWLRLDKLAAEQLSAQRGPKVVDHTGVPVDIARVNGQKRDPSKALAMHHRRLYGLLRYTSQDNASTVGQFEQLARALEPDFSISQLVD